MNSVLAFLDYLVDFPYTDFSGVICFLRTSREKTAIGDCKGNGVQKFLVGFVKRSIDENTVIVIIFHISDFHFLFGDKASSSAGFNFGADFELFRTMEAAFAALREVTFLGKFVPDVKLPTDLLKAGLP